MTTKTIIIDGVSGLWTQIDETQEPIQEPIPEGYLSPHFREAEFDCNHCGKYGDTISMELIGVLEDCRAHFGKSITINSGVRCDYHNAAVGGAKNSRHKVENADAADVVVRDVAPSLVHQYFVDTYPGRYGIGKYNSFTHIDTRPGGSARW